ncbi:hypothetical protein IM660_05270 [Ruania alkalisoli]|uniref:Uncharacterized protein n=1 Tax=Ruania alkalisoli TaxID=2779775 RepID=A0A7M1SW44_9MICO|nr:hypothetical protein [Ruania alkalisoli]QOR71691.1 hypothetical protein IM660_05270 [Ruania alkalisoli]
MPSRRAATACLVAVIAAATIGLAACQESDPERTAALEAWHADLTAWEAEQSAALAPSLVESVDLTPGPAPALTPVWPGSESQDPATADAINAACTTLTSYAEQADLAPGPPAVPAGLEPTTAEREQFETAQAALAGLRAGLSEPLSAIRRYCGTAPTLMTAHAGADLAEANQAVADALRVQCPVADLAQVCTATIDAAENMAADPADAARIRTDWSSAVAGSGVEELAGLGPQEVEQTLAELVASRADGAAQRVHEVATEFEATW